MPVKLLLSQQVLAATLQYMKDCSPARSGFVQYLPLTGSSLLTDIQFFRTNNIHKNRLRARYTRIFATAAHSRMTWRLEQTLGIKSSLKSSRVLMEKYQELTSSFRNSNNVTHQRKKEILGGARKARIDRSAAHESDVSPFFRR